MSTLRIAGQPVETCVQDVQSAAEPWSEYLLSDGTVLRAKTVAVRVHRALQPDPDGKPVYFIETQTIVATREP